MRRGAGGPGRAVITVMVAAVLAASPGRAETGRGSVSFAPVPLWSGMPTDDDGDGNDAYDHTTGLGTSVNCFKTVRGANVLTVQYSYSRADVLRFYAAVVPKSAPPPKPARPALRQLTPRHPMLLWRRTVKTCDVPYALFVAYPK